jgi:multidrug transporter EmrE-like cation transporter
MEIYLWSLLAIISMICASICIKYSIVNDNINWFCCAILLYVILSLCYLKLYSNNNVSIIYTVINILAIICMTCIGFIFFNEKCNINIILGLIFGILAIILLTNK